MKKGKVEKIIDIIFWMILLGTMFFTFIELFHEEFDKTETMLNQYRE